MSKILDVVFIETIEGREKPRYHNCGILMIKDDGKMSIKLNVIPACNWNGWFNCFEQKAKENPGQGDYRESF
jgi:hypothetical protein